MSVNHFFPNTAPLLSQIKMLHVFEVLGIAAIFFLFLRTSQKRTLDMAQASGGSDPAAGEPRSADAVDAARKTHAKTDLPSINTDLTEAEDRFALVLRTFDIATFYCDLEHRYTWSHNFVGDPAILVGKTDFEILPTESAETLKSLKEKAISDGGMHSGELQIDIGHEVRTYAVQVAPRRDAMGHIIGTLAVSCDVTEKTVWQNHLLLMMREVNHRARNMLAIIGSVCRLTEKNAVDVRQYRDKVSGRVMSLAATMDIVAKDNWIASSLRKLISAQLTIVPHSKARRINVRGDDVLIQSKAGQNIGLALHELVSNAVEHGALKGPKGHVDISIETEGDQNGAGIKLVWQETLCDPCGEKNSDGFGMRALEMILATELAGTCEIEWPTSGFRCTLSLPASVLGVDNAFITPATAEAPANTKHVMVESLTGTRIALDTT